MERAAYERLYPRESLERTLATDARADGRPLGRARARASARGTAARAFGSALVKHGRTTALAGVRGSVTTPDATAPESGFLDVRVEFAPQANGEERGGDGWARRDACAATVRDALRSAEVLGRDLRDLCVEAGNYVWRLRVDVVVLDDDGAVGDAALTAAVAALRDCVLPETVVTRGKLVVGESGAVDADGVRKGTPLKIRSTPVCLTTALFGEHLLVDPTRREEALCECEVSVVLTEDGMLRGVFKSGGEVEATEEILMKCIAAARLQYAASAKVILDDDEA